MNGVTNKEGASKLTHPLLKFVYYSDIMNYTMNKLSIICHLRPLQQRQRQQQMHGLK